VLTCYWGGPRRSPSGATEALLAPAPIFRSRLGLRMPVNVLLSVIKRCTSRAVHFAVWSGAEKLCRLLLFHQS
jgi:hypothetical protein